MMKDCGSRGRTYHPKNLNYFAAFRISRKTLRLGTPLFEFYTGLLYLNLFQADALQMLDYHAKHI